MVLRNIYIIIFALLFSCTHNAKKSSHITGKYVNAFETGVEHYVILSSDSTYRHYYKSALLKLTNNGRWKFDQFESGEIKIVFLDWASYGAKRDNNCKKCLFAAELGDEELIFSYDLPDEMNFRK